MDHQTGDARELSSRIVSFLPWALIPVALIIVDQLLKLIMVAWIGPDADQHRIDLAGSFLAFDYVENRGAAFGIMGSATEALALVSLAIAAGGLYMLWRDHVERPQAAFAIALVVGGAIGNVIDRVYRGYVVDFVAVGDFPRFNVADSAITIGVLLLLWAMVREDSRHDDRATQGNQRTNG